jgi:hypothetical protein
MSAYFAEEWLLKTDRKEGWQQIVCIDTITKIGEPCHINDCDLKPIVDAHNLIVRELKT